MIQQSVAYQPDNHPALAPEVLLPSQFADACGGRSERTSEQRLWSAVLTDALECWTKHLRWAETGDELTDKRRRRALLWERADTWIFAKQPAVYFSFDDVCLFLGIESASLREALIRWRESGQTLPKVRRSPSVPTRNHAYSEDTKAEVIRDIQQTRASGITLERAAHIVSRQRDIPVGSVKSIWERELRDRRGAKPLRGPGNPKIAELASIRMIHGPHRNSAA